MRIQFFTSTFFEFSYPTWFSFITHWLYIYAVFVCFNFSSQASSVEEINIICPPWPETEETEKLMPPVPENNHMSCLDLQEREN